MPLLWVKELQVVLRYLPQREGQARYLALQAKRGEGINTLFRSSFRSKIINRDRDQGSNSLFLVLQAHSNWIPRAQYMMPTVHKKIKVAKSQLLHCLGNKIQEMTLQHQTNKFISQWCPRDPLIDLICFMSRVELWGKDFRERGLKASKKRNKLRLINTLSLSYVLSRERWRLPWDTLNTLTKIMHIKIDLNLLE